MSDIPIPQKGSPITLEWGKAVTESCNAARAIGTGGLVRSGPFGLGEAPLPANLRDRRPSVAIKPYPFKVRVVKPDPTDASTWKLQIYLPSEKNILIYKGRPLDPTDSEDIAASSEDKWYNLQHIDGLREGYLSLSVETDEDGNESVSYSIDDISAASNSRFTLAYIGETQDDDGNHLSYNIEQYIRSALYIGDGAEWRDPEPGLGEED